MIQDFNSGNIMPCECGYNPTHYSVAYGRTPYSIHCANCNKSLHGGHGNIESFIIVWNYIYACIPSPGRMFDINEILIEAKEVRNREF